MSEGVVSFEDVGVAAADLLAGLHETSFERPWSAKEFAGLLATPGTVALIAIAPDTEPAGMILFRQAAGEAEILTLAVRPGMRRSGIATALVGEMKLRLKQATDSVFLEVASSNRAARELYRSTGFAEVGQRPGYYGSGATTEDALIMRAELF